MSKVEMEIRKGSLGLMIVDRDEVGYSDDWQAPGGAVLPGVSLDEYEAHSTAWSCQIIDGALTSSPDTTTRETPATWCEPATTTPTPGASSYEFSGSFLQDATSSTGLTAFLYKHDTKEAYIYASFEGDAAPRFIGRCVIQSGSIGGAARETLTSDLTLPMVRKPDAEFGSGGSTIIVLGAEGTPASGATAGTPGSWTPAGSDPPASPADLIANDPVVVTASPATAWTTGQYVQTQTSGTGGRAHWSGTAWVAGAAT